MYQCLECNKTFDTDKEALACCADIEAKCAICGIDSGFNNENYLSDLKTEVGELCELFQRSSRNNLNIFLCKNCLEKLSKNVIPDALDEALD